MFPFIVYGGMKHGACRQESLDFIGFFVFSACNLIHLKTSR
jgi:hypothetical protein